MPRWIYLLFFALMACADPQGSAPGTLESSQDGIIGGKVVPPRSRESLAVVHIEKQNSASFCTGTLIDRDIVLTAAHCADEPRQLKVIFETDPFRHENPSSSEVLGVRIHPLYGARPFGERNDLAVFLLKTPAPADRQIAKIIPEDQKIQVGLEFTAIGYGRTNGYLLRDPYDPEAGMLRQVNLTMTKWRMKDSTREFSVDQSQGKGVCVGDSGGPAMIWDSFGQPYILGVASGVYYEAFPVELASNDEPRNHFQQIESLDYCGGLSVYIETSSYREWIEAAISELRSGKMNQ